MLPAVRTAHSSKVSQIHLFMDLRGRFNLSNTVISSSGINAQVLTAAAADLERAGRVCSPQEKATRWHKERFR